MSTAVMIALSNPLSADQDREFNDWYERVHAPELLALPGINRVRRYKLAGQMLPPSEKGDVLYRYLAIYDVDDAAAAAATIGAASPNFEMSPTMDFATAFGASFDEVFSLDRLPA